MMSLPKRRRGNFVHPNQSPTTRPAGSFHRLMNYASPVSDFQFHANQVSQRSTYPLPLVYQSPHNPIDSHQNYSYYSSQNSHWRHPVQSPIPSHVCAFVQPHFLQNGEWSPSASVQHSIPPSSFSHVSIPAQIPPHSKTPVQSQNYSSNRSLHQTPVPPRNNFSNRSLHHSSQIKPLTFHQTVQARHNTNYSSPKTSAIVSPTPVERKLNNSDNETVWFPTPDIELVVKDLLNPFNATQNCTNPHKRKGKKKNKKNKIIVPTTSPKEKEKEEIILLW